MRAGGGAGGVVVGVGRGHKLSVEVMEIILWQHYFLGRSTSRTADDLQTSTNTLTESTVRATINRYEETGIVDYPARAPRERLMTEHDRALMLGIVEEQPWLYLSEIAAELRALTYKDFTREYVHFELHAAGLSLKKMQIKQAARDDAQRAEYWQAVRKWVTHPEQLVFGDETGIDGRTARRKRGWGARNTRVNVIQVRHRGVHISILALFALDGFVSFNYVQGGYDTQAFVAAMRQMLPQVMGPYPGPRSVLVLDNCRIHHAERAALDDILHNIDGQGGRAIVLFLAPYSPIDNPIEFGFSVFKNCWRKHSDEWDTLDLEGAIRACMMRCYRDGQPAGAARHDPSAAATFDHCGYSLSGLKELC